MGTIQVPGRLSGRTYTVDIAGDTPSEAEQARIRAMVEERENRYVQRFSEQFGFAFPAPDDGTAFGRRLAHAAPQIKSTLGTTIETVGQQLGLAGLAEYGRGMEQDAARRLFDLSLQQPAPTTIEDVAAAQGFFPTIDAGLTYAGELAGEQAGQFAASLAGGGVGAVAGGLTGGIPGALVGFGVGAGLTEAPLLFGANVQRQEEEVAAGRKESVDLTDALASTVDQAALTAVTNALAGAGVFLRPGARLFTRIVSGAVVGGTTESLNEIGQQVLERHQAGLPIDSPDAIKEYIDAGVAGGILGVGAGGLGGVAGRGPAAEDGEVPQPAPAALGLPKPTKPGVAKISNVMRQGPRFGPATTTTVRLDDGATLTLQGDATEADIARAVDQHNQTKAAAEAQAAPKAPTPTVEDIPEAEIIPDEGRPTGGVSIDEDLAEARAVYDERLAIAEEGGTDPEEAQRIAARAAVAYVDSLDDARKARLSRFRSTMARLSAGPTRGVMQPDIPDEAYASEFGPVAPPSLFDVELPEPAPVAEPATAPEPKYRKAAEGAAKKSVEQQEQAKAVVEAVRAEAETRPAAQMGEPAKATAAPAPQQPSQVLTDDLVTQMGVREGKSAALRKLVGQPLTDTKVVRALDRWAQNDRATPENKALARSLITGMPVAPVPEPQPQLEMALETPPITEAPGARTSKKYTVSTEDAGDFEVRVTRFPDGSATVFTDETVQDYPVEFAASKSDEDLMAYQLEPVGYKGVKDDTTAAAPEPSEVGAGVPGGGPSVEAVGQRLGDVQPAEGVEAPEPGGLGGDLPLPVDTAAAEGAERDTLTEATPAAAPPAAAPAPSVLPDYNTIPGAVSGAARQRVPAPVSVPEVVGAPSQRLTAERLDQLFAQRYAANTPEEIKRAPGARFLSEASVQEQTPDRLTVEDKQLILNLLSTKDAALSPEARAAKLYFSKVPRPMDAVLMVVDDLTAGYDKYRAEPGTDPYTRAFMAGTGRTAARQAMAFIKGRMSAAMKREIAFRENLSAQQNRGMKTWVATVDRVTLTRQRREAMTAEALEAAKESGYVPYDVAADMAAADPLVALDRDMHYSVRNALNAGDLKGALQALAAVTNNADVRAIASRFAELTGTTRVKVLYPGDPARNIGRSAGVYWQSDLDPERQNIIYINGQIGMKDHVLLHEMAHAVTANLVDAQPNHPVVKQLETLLSQLRDAAPRGANIGQPGDFYGLRNVKEMIAEAYGRATFGDTDNGLRDLMKRTTYKTYTQTSQELPLNAWQRFKEIVGNFLRSLIGRPPKPYPRRTVGSTIYGKETALDRFHRLVDGMLSEAPQVLPATAIDRAVSSPMAARTLLNNALLTAEPWSAAGKDKLSRFMSSSIPQRLRGALLGLLQLDWFNDLAGGYFPQIAKLKVIDDLRRGKTLSRGKKMEIILADMATYGKKSPELFSKLISIQGQASLAGVDPTEPVSKYAGNKENTDAWHDLNRQLTTADTSGEMRALFRKLRNALKEYRAEIERVLRLQAKTITGDTAKANNLVQMLLDKLDAENAIDPYFSLMRTGDYWLVYTAEDTTGAPVGTDAMGRPRRPTAQFVQAFETPFALARFRAQLEAKKDADGKPIAWDFNEIPKPTSYRSNDKFVPPEFVQGALNIISSFSRPNASVEERAKVDDAVTAMQDLFLRLTPDRSFLQGFIKRKGTRGFMGDITPIGVIDAPKDFIAALAEKTNSMNMQLANMEYGAQIQQLINEAGETLKRVEGSATTTIEDKLKARAYHDEFVLRAKFAKSPQVGAAAQITRGITFGWTLGFNVAGAFNNLMQIPMIGMTELAGRYGGLRAATRELGFAMRALQNAGKTQKVLTYGAEGKEQRLLSNADNYGSLVNYFEADEKGNYQLRTDMKIPPQLRTKLADLDVLAEVLENNGMLAASMSQEMLEAEGNWLQNINRWSGFMMHHAERFNRQSMAIAAYNLELAKTKGSGPASREAKLAAAQKAIEITERVNGTIGASTAPRLAQGPVGSVVFMFKRFGLHMARYIINTANQAARGMSKEDRAVARYQIGGMLLTTALFAGAQGMPFYSELMSILNLFFTEEDEEPFEIVIQKFLGEPYYHGALNYLLGIEIASRISMSGLIFRENQIEKDQPLIYDLLEMLGGPAVGVYMNVDRGVNLINDGEFYRGVEAMVPSAIKNILKAGRYGTEGATTLRGDEIVPLTPVDIVRQVIGYTPEAYARTQERVSTAKRVDEGIRNKKRRLLRKYNMAVLDGDFAEVREILKEMREFRRQHPEDAIMPDTLEKSLRGFVQRSGEMISGVSFTDPARAQRNIDGFDEDTTLWADFSG